MIELALLTFSVVASIGPTNLLAIKEGIKRGAHNTFWILFGGVTVDLFYANLVGFGLSNLGENYYFKSILLSVGTLVFIYMGATGLRAALTKDSIAVAQKKYDLPPFITGVMMTLPNPFTIIIWATAFTSLKITYAPLILFFVIIGVGAFWSGVEAIVIRFFRKIVKTTLIQIIEGITSIILLGFAIKFGYQLVQLIFA